MFEKVNPSHPDKIADRIAGAIVDLAYSKARDPKIAVEVLIGHGECNIIVESSLHIAEFEVSPIVDRIAGLGHKLNYHIVKQDDHLAENQKDRVRCGDNGIFKGVPVTAEQQELTRIVKDLYKSCEHDGKFIIDNYNLIMCQSNVDSKQLASMYPDAIVNPLGDWSGGLEVDCGATNRKLGSDMGDSVTGGGLHGKDLSKADVSINIYAFCQAQNLRKPIEMSCAIGDTEIDRVPYEKIIDFARNYIADIGGFEKFAEWGLIR